MAILVGNCFRMQLCVRSTGGALSRSASNRVIMNKNTFITLARLKNDFEISSGSEIKGTRR